MAEYIEREAALSEFQKVCDVCMTLVRQPECGECSVADTVRKVKRIPAADVKPVVRSRWVYDCERTAGDGWTYRQYHCEKCGNRELGGLQNYCPNCGCSMRDEE